MKIYLFNPHLILMGFLTLTLISFSLTIKDKCKNSLSESSIIANKDSIFYGKKINETKLNERIRLKINNIESFKPVILRQLLKQTAVLINNVIPSQYGNWLIKKLQRKLL